MLRQIEGLRYSREGMAEYIHDLDPMGEGFVPYPEGKWAPPPRSRNRDLAPHDATAHDLIGPDQAKAEYRDGRKKGLDLVDGVDGKARKFFADRRRKLGAVTRTWRGYDKT